MHDPTEYPGFPRTHVWYFGQVIAALAAPLSPVFDVDRFMGTSSAQAVPTGAATSNPNHLFRTTPIGLRYIADFSEVGGAAAASFDLFGAMEETFAAFGVLHVGVVIPASGRLLIDAVTGFPFLLARLNGHATLSTTVLGAFRVLPT